VIGTPLKKGIRLLLYSERGLFSLHGKNRGMGHIKQLISLLCVLTKDFMCHPLKRNFSNSQVYFSILECICQFFYSYLGNNNLKM
jgi:hypothetical protein